MAAVQILSRLEGERPDESGVSKPVLVVTYSTAAVPPRSVTLPLAEADDAAVAEAIRLDLAAINDGPAQTLTI